MSVSRQASHHRCQTFFHAQPSGAGCEPGSMVGDGSWPPASLTPVRSGLSYNQLEPSFPVKGNSPAPPWTG